MTEARKRRSTLAGLLPEMKAAAEQSIPQTVTQLSAVPSDDKPDIEPETKSSATAQQASKKEASSAPPERVNFDDYERKEARLREDQVDDLAALVKRIKRTKKPGGERITDNTLIRVAVDMLLARKDELRGTTESELRKSVSS